MATIANLAIGLTARHGPFVKGMRKARMAVTRFGKAVFNVTKRMAKWGALIGGAGVVAGIKIYADFTRQLAMVGTMLDEKTRPALERMGRELRGMSITAGESTETLARGLYDILSAGIDASKATDVLRVASRAATAGLTETATAADALTSAMNAYGVSADRARDVSDVLFAIVRKGKLTFADIAQNIGKVAPTAALAGISLQELGAALSTITRQGVKVEEAATFMQQLLLAMLDPQAKAAKAAKQLGFELSVQRLRAEGLLPIIQDITNASVKQKIALAGNVRAFKALAVLSQDVEGFASDLNFTMNAGGESLRAYAEMSNTLAFRLQQLKQIGVEALRIAGEKLAPVLQNIIEMFGGIEGLAKSIPGKVAAGIATVLRWVASLADFLREHLFKDILSVEAAFLRFRQFVTFDPAENRKLARAFVEVTAAVEAAGTNAGKFKQEIEAFLTTFESGASNVADELANTDKALDRIASKTRGIAEAAKVAVKAAAAWTDLAPAALERGTAAAFSAERRTFDPTQGGGRIQQGILDGIRKLSSLSEKQLAEMRKRPDELVVTMD